MIYKDFNGKKISSLGLGCMRLPTINGIDSQIDRDKAGEMIDYAIEHGINYFDTAWGYHSGNSESVLGSLLSRYPRESYFLASKFPGYDLSNMDKIESIFPEQLRRCQVDYFDFYLFHNVCELNIEQYLDKKYGIRDYIKKQKENGKIRHIGFSVHGNIDTTRRFLEAYADDIEFCQIQLNYLDLTFQDAQAKLDICREYNIPVWVMEPIRGGKLASISDEYLKRLSFHREGVGAVEWAFRFLQSIPEVTLTLSGMSSFEQLKENIRIFSHHKPLNEGEMKTLLSIADDMVQNRILPCTACKYCISHCPKELNIPYLLKLYNEHTFTGGGFIAPMALNSLPKDKLPSTCIGCHACEQVCPQNIKISEAMADFSSKLAR